MREPVLLDQQCERLARRVNVSDKRTVVDATQLHLPAMRKHNLDVWFVGLGVEVQQYTVKT
jgi:hypothetical protein